MSDGGAYWSHAEGNDVHRSAAHAAFKQVGQGAAHFIRISPMVGGARIRLLRATNKGSAFHSGNISWV